MAYVAVLLGTLVAGTARADITSALVVQYDFDNSYADSAGSGYTLNAVGTPSFVPGATGFSQALSVSGGNYVMGSTSTPLPLGNASRTIAFRVYFPSASSSNFCDAVAYGDSSNNNQARVFFFPGRALYFSAWGPDINSGVAFPSGTWKHVAVTVSSGSTIDIYVDGSSVGTFSWNGGTSLNTTTNANGLGIGNIANGCQDGAYIDDVRIYSRALTAADVSELAAAVPPASAGSVTASASFTATNGSTASQVLALSNGAAATGALDVSAIGFSGTDASMFSLGTAPSNPCSATFPFSLAAGASCNLRVDFAPPASTSATTKSASLNVSSNNSTALSSVLTGNIPASGVASISASGGFAATVVNQTSPSVTFTLSNGGALQLNGLSAAFTGANASAFSLTGGTCASSLAVGASCTYTATFHPTGAIAAATTMTATLAVSTSNSSVITYDVAALTGANAAQIPTLSEWGMIVLALLLMVSMFVAISRNRSPHV